MKEHLRQLAASALDSTHRAFLVREYLQARVLESLQDAKLFSSWSFLGGTALRFLFGLPRFSEDLDFSLVEPGLELGLERAMTSLERTFRREGYELETRVNTKRCVASAWVRFPGLPFEFGLSPRPAQVLSIKVETDTRPPAGARHEVSIVRRHATLRLQHHDRSSLLAGKLHALLSRPWTKGRDLFDLAWYLADREWPSPNLDLLNAALSQSGWNGAPITNSSWKAVVRDRLSTVRWAEARADVRPFLEKAQDLDLVSAEVLERLLVRFD